MIHLPSELTPSELLSSEEMPSYIEDLLRHARTLLHAGYLEKAERCAADALEATQEPATSNAGQAVVRMHLSDIRREMGRLGPTLDGYRRAYRIFQRRPSRYQRHNEAVAAYALGLTYQLLGSEMEALKWYQSSIKLIQQVRDDWGAVNAQRHCRTCKRLSLWLQTLTRYLTDINTRTDTRTGRRIWVPIILEEEDPRFAIAHLEIEHYQLRDELTVNGRCFRIHSLPNQRQRVSVAPADECYVYKIPPGELESWGVDKRDYVLVVRGKHADRVGPGILEAGESVRFGQFVRDEEGQISFVSSNAETIGGDVIDESEDLRIGYIAALLKPKPRTP